MRAVWPVVVVAGLLLAGACSDTESTGPETTTGTTTGTSSGTSSGTSAGTSAGTAAGTSAGTGAGTTADCGSLEYSTDAACQGCVEASCCAELAACDTGSDCASALACTAGCSWWDSPCHETCLNAATQSGADGWIALQDCRNADCADECMQSADATCAPAGPADGSCVTLGGGNECNPITSEPCDTAAGEACDIGETGFTCYPGPNDVALCDACGPEAGFCAPGHACYKVCAKFCCGDTECAPGICQKDFGFPSGVGICTGGN